MIWGCLVSTAYLLSMLTIELLCTFDLKTHKEYRTCEVYEITSNLEGFIYKMK